MPILTAQGRMSVKTASICWARNSGLTSKMPDMPVVFWATLDFQPVPEKRDHWLLADGTDFAWKCNEHCLLLVGYDEENYWFNDPWHDHGVCPQPKQLVEDCHAAQGMFAVTLRPKGEV